MLKDDSKNVCNEFPKCNDSLTFIFCVANLCCCLEISFQYVEIKAHSPFRVATLQLEHRFCLLFSLSGSLKLNLTMCFLFSMLFFCHLLFPCSLLHVTYWYGSISACYLPVSSLFWCFLFIPTPISLWSYLSVAKATQPLVLVPCRHPLSSIMPVWHKTGSTAICYVMIKMMELLSWGD